MRTATSKLHDHLLVLLREEVVGDEGDEVLLQLLGRSEDDVVHAERKVCPIGVISRVKGGSIQGHKELRDFIIAC